MKVRELIEKLKEFDGDLPVKIVANPYDDSHINFVNVLRAPVVDKTSPLVRSPVTGEMRRGIGLRDMHVRIG